MVLAVLLVGKPSQRLLLTVLQSLFCVCCIALFPAKSMVSSRTLQLCVGCVTLFSILFCFV